MTTAKFTINGTPSSPRGFDATNGQVLTLQLETNPAPDVYQVVFSLYDPAVPSSPLATKSAPTVVPSPSSGQPTVVTGPVTATMPVSGVHSYAIRCVLNGGVEQATGKVRPDWIYERIVSIRSGNGQRKILPGESVQYADRSWSDAQNEGVDAVAGTAGPAQAVADLATLRATVMTSGQVFTVLPPGPTGPWVFNGSDGAGVPDDGESCVKPNQVALVSSPGRLNNAGSTSPATIAALRLMASGKVKRTSVLCYSALNDGGGDEFLWDATNNNTTNPDNGYDLIVPTVLVGGTGAWRRRKSGDSVSLKHCGVKADAREVYDASITGTTFTSATIALTAADIGKTLLLEQAPTATTAAGTVATTNGSKAIVGTGTSFTAYVPGTQVVISGLPYFIDAIASNTSMTVDTAATATAAGLTMIIGGTIITTLTGVTNATTGTMAATAAATCAGLHATLGTDDTAALAALRAAHRVIGGQMLLPAGTLLADALSVGAADNGSLWRSAGFNPFSTGLPATKIKLKQATTHLLKFSGCYAVNFEGIVFDGSHLPTKGTWYYPGDFAVTQHTYKNCVIMGASVASDLVHIEGTIQVDQIHFKGCYLSQSLRTDYDRAHTCLFNSNTNAFNIQFDATCHANGAHFIQHFIGGSASWALGSQWFNASTDYWAIDTQCQPCSNGVYIENVAASPLGVPFIHQYGTTASGADTAVVLRGCQINATHPIIWTSQQTLIIEGDNKLEGNVQIDTPTAGSVRNVIFKRGATLGAGSFTFFDTGGFGGGQKRLVFDGAPDVKSFGAKGNGVNDDSAALVAISGLLSSGATIDIPPGVYRCSNNVTFPAGYRLRFHPGAQLSIDSGKTVLFNSPIEAAPSSQIFSGLGLVLFGVGVQDGVYPNWWGPANNAFEFAGTAAWPARVPVWLLDQSYVQDRQLVAGLAASTTITAGVAAGVSSVTLTAVSPYVQPGYILEMVNVSGGLPTATTEKKIIASVVGAVVTFTSPLLYTYAAGAFARITHDYLTIEGVACDPFSALDQSNGSRKGPRITLTGTSLPATGAMFTIGKNIEAYDYFTWGVRLRGFGIETTATGDGTGASQDGVNALYLWNPFDFEIDRVSILGPSGNTRYGLRMQGGVNGRLNHVRVNGNGFLGTATKGNYGKGVIVGTNHAGGPTTTTTFNKCYWHGCYEGLDNQASFVVVRDSVFELCLIPHINTYAGGTLESHACHYEACGDDAIGAGIGGYFAGASITNLYSPKYIGYSNVSYVYGHAANAKINVFNPDFSCSSVSALKLFKSAEVNTGNPLQVTLVNPRFQQAGWLVTDATAVGGENPNWRMVRFPGLSVQRYRFVIKALAANRALAVIGNEDGTADNVFTLPEGGYLLGFDAQYSSAMTAGTITVQVDQGVAGTYTNRLLASAVATLPQRVDRAVLSVPVAKNDTLRCQVATSAGFLAAAGDLVVDVYVAFGNGGF